ncbi:putative member of the p24 [Scheffersomyces spartinae]|uniref:Member of the p24 n=1 Tax=Scheffersomyces spartinae TaxID=45513 RepID=A0A9P7VEI8_9ASCO|nr:putative member of the p24 [Scheffersomyces spartinae]KAG7196212.1 putative member of the p24 [Scheffersomyces spartinae]
MFSLFKLVVTLLVAFTQLGSALHFYLDTAQTRCFYEELPAKTLVVTKLLVHELIEGTNLYAPNDQLSLVMTVDETFDNNHRVVSQKSTTNGDFTFTSTDEGEHKFCLTPLYNDGSMGKKHRIYFDLVVGSADEYVDSKSSNKVDHLTKQIQNLNRKLQNIHREQESIRNKEAIFRDQSESTNGRVLKWTVVQLIVLVGTCFYQLRHLKSFFVKQKIV